MESGLRLEAGHPNFACFLGATQKTDISRIEAFQRLTLKVRR